MTETPAGIWVEVRMLIRFVCRKLLVVLDQHYPGDSAAGPQVPKAPQLSSKREIQIMAIKFGYTLAAPEIVDTTTAIVRFKAVVDGVETIEDLAVGQAPSEVIAPLDTAVVLAFAAIDQAGNVSAYSPALEFIAVDDIPPAVPNGPVMMSHREIPDAPPVEEPPAEEPPVEEPPVEEPPVEEPPVEEPPVEEPPAEETPAEPPIVG